ncbi:flagellar hook capping FlgD N-terminal domain-containing protein [Vannielia litorea]|uniref:flagellar hook capping FlgD N-terminal domain-containing protein n=1 Tax=Vannielia litorea TaxID=1217970 RepID=UPI001BCE6322|nr:flagellar hook capping FlgD N-terminal domain-containing protein [Vannielia litorea]MBS8226153.1 flagellar basal body rod modification protein [Vannielia litorea]
METTSATATTPTLGSSQSSQGYINSDFETFLKMMTTQLQNQDPLNPLDSADFAVQLATFSNVEQQVRTNVLLEELNAQMGMTGMSELANFVGMETRVAAPARFTGQPIEMTLDLASGADAGVLVVTDEFGIERQRLMIDSSAPFHVWQGVDDGGNVFADGTYSFSVESYEGDELIDTRQAEVYARVEEARLEDGETMLLLNSGVTVPASAVTALRFPVVYEESAGASASMSRQQLSSATMR